MKHAKPQRCGGQLVLYQIPGFSQRLDAMSKFNLIKTH